VAERGDARLGKAAKRALDKIAAVLPAELRATLDASGLLVGPGEPIPADDETVARLRQAIRNERKTELHYRDKNETATRRTIWPFALGYFDRVQVLVAWCELRQDFRHFRTDRIGELTVTDERYPRRRQALMKEWRAREGMPER
jgi:predicted DNA-binding transcriptional regulator YafY